MKPFHFVLFLILMASCNDRQPVPVNPQTVTDSLRPATDPGQPAPAAVITDNLNSALACLLAEINYCNALSDTLHKYLPGWELVWNPASVNGNHAFLATNGKSYALSIRGSLIGFSEDAFNNWILQDLNVAEQHAWPFSGNPAASVSAGSYGAWANIVSMKDHSGKTLLQMLDSLCQDQTPLLITGHSLGGNLATVVASWVDAHFKQKNDRHPDINVITFAAPAAGNRFFAEDFNRRFPRSVRFENINDIVPKFPVGENIAALQQLYRSGPDATKIKVGYGIIQVNLSTIFTGIQVTLQGLSVRPGYSAYMQTNGSGTMLQVPLSGKNNRQEASAWFAEAGYQHSAEQYAAILGVPVIHTP